MGEPTFNSSVITFTKNSLLPLVQARLNNSLVHPVVSTMMPRNNRSLKEFITAWCGIKNDLFNGNAGLQLSINSTNETQRQEMFNYNSASLKEISELMREVPKPKGRKYTLNFAWADDYETNGRALAELFIPEYFMVKITPIHATKRAAEFNIKTTGGYNFYEPYRKPERAFVDAGYDTLVFVPSLDEDKSRITCGNAVLLKS